MLRAPRMHWIGDRRRANDSLHLIYLHLVRAISGRGITGIGIGSGGCGITCL